MFEPHTPGRKVFVTFHYGRKTAKQYFIMDTNKLGIVFLQSECFRIISVTQKIISKTKNQIPHYYLEENNNAYKKMLQSLEPNNVLSCVKAPMCRTLR